MNIIHFPPKKKGNKFGAKRVFYDGIWFASIKEKEYYKLLKYRRMGGEISDIELQPKFDHMVNNKKVFTYIADFAFTESETNERVIVDVKGLTKGSAYQLFKVKKKCIEAEYGVKIEEV